MVATTGSRYANIKILPPLSFLTPTLCKTKANAVGIKPNKSAKIKSSKFNLGRSPNPRGKNIKIKKRVCHQAKKISKSPFVFKFSWLLFLLL